MATNTTFNLAEDVLLDFGPEQISFIDKRVVPGTEDAPRYFTPEIKFSGAKLEGQPLVLTIPQSFQKSWDEWADISDGSLFVRAKIRVKAGTEMSVSPQGYVVCTLQYGQWRGFAQQIEIEERATSFDDV